MGPCSPPKGDPGLQHPELHLPQFLGSLPGMGAAFGALLVTNLFPRRGLTHSAANSSGVNPRKQLWVLRRVGVCFGVGGLGRGCPRGTARRRDPSGMAVLGGACPCRVPAG